MKAPLIHILMAEWADLFFSNLLARQWEAWGGEGSCELTCCPAAASRRSGWLMLSDHHRPSDLAHLERNDEESCDISFLTGFRLHHYQVPAIELHFLHSLDRPEH